MKKEMLINVLQAEECRIAIIEDGLLEELYVERSSHETYTGNIYKGRVVNLEPAIQAAFVDFSIGRNGFLHVSDVEPRYYSRHPGGGEGGEQGGRESRGARRSGPGEGRPGRSGYGRGEGRPGGRRDDRRGPAQSIPSVTPAEFGTELPAGPADFGTGLDEFAFGDFNPIASTELSPEMAPRQPEGGRPRDRDRDRGRRGGGGGRDRGGRPPRGQRDRSYRGGSRPMEPQPTEFTSQAPDYQGEVLQSSYFGESESLVVESYHGDFTAEDLARDLAATDAAETMAPEISPEPEPARLILDPEPPFTPEPEPRPEVVYEAPKVVPPPQPSRPKKSFGAGLEDWDTSFEAPARKPFVAPIKPVVPEFQAPEPPPAPATEVQAPVEPARSVSTVTRAISPAAPPARPRSRFGSGLIEDAEPVEPQIRPESAFAESSPVIDRLTVSEMSPETPAVQAIETSRSVVEEVRAQVESVELQVKETTPPWPESAEGESEVALDIPGTEGLTDAAPAELDAGEALPRGRGRRRTSTGRGRGRPPKAVEPEIEVSAEAELPTPDPGLPGLESAGEAEVQISQPTADRRPSGRDFIRARGGNRPPLGPREEIPEHLWNLTPAEPDQTEPGDEEEGESRTGGRYVPRLERERRGRGRRPRRPAEFDRTEMASGPDEEGLLAEGEPGEDAEGLEPVADEDPRLGERGGFSRNRRRRRRRRPGMKEKGPSTGSEPVEFDPLAPEIEGEGRQSGGDWSELDWSASPPGAAESLAEDGLSEDTDLESEETSASSARPKRFRKGPRRQRRGGRYQPEIGPAPGDDLGDEMDDDSESSSESYVPDPNDIVEPELQEEIRREAEEIEAMEIELGIRQPGEIRESLRGGGRGPFKPPIQEIFQRNDEVLVQVIKESLGTKGPTLSTYISIPGRYLVLMPGLQRVGVSRKIGDDAQRRRLRDKMNALNPPKGLGFIVRTAGVDRTKRELARDLAYLLRLWKTILRRIKRTRSPAPIYQESDMIIRTIRDIFTGEIDTIWIDEPSAFERAQEFLKNVMPKYVDRLKLYGDKTPLFHKYGIEDEIAKIGQRHVPLPDGGSIVIDQTEALVAIDVNSGSFRADDDAERNAYEMNLRAAREIARQLRLRDLGGVIVNDFIDMRDERHRRGVERALRDAIRRDRARTKILRMSQFGLIEMTRQRIRPSIKRSIYEDCPNCLAQGVVKTAESMSIDVMRILAMAANRQDIRRINITCSQNVANFLNNRKRQDLARIERDGHLTIHIRPEADVAAEFLQVDGFGNYNTEIRLYPTQAMTSHRRMPNTTGVGPAASLGHGHQHGHGHGHGHSR